MKPEEQIKSLTDDLHTAYDTIRGLEFELENAKRSDKLDAKSTERPTYKTGLRVAMYAAKLNESVEELEKENAALRDEKERLVQLLSDLCSVAKVSMHEANKDGADWRIKEELEPARAAIDVARKEQQQ